MNIGIDIGGSHIGIALIENEKIVKEVEQEIEKREGIEKNILDIVVTFFVVRKVLFTAVIQWAD